MTSLPRTPLDLLPSHARKLFLAFLVCLGLCTPAARAQQQLPAQEAHHPALPQGPLTLEDCVRMGLERQPSLVAARASLAAAEDQRQALENMRLAALISRELSVRKQQAALGVTIAAAGVEQAEWDTIYAVTRHYFSVRYALEQQKVVQEMIRKLSVFRDQARDIVEKGKDPNINVTVQDVNKLDLHIMLLKGKLQQAVNGIELAKAALREAMGLPGDCPFDVILLELPSPGEDLDRCQLVNLALSRRGELVQAVAAAEVTGLEVTAQERSSRLVSRTFAAGADVHSRPIPQEFSNRTYRPGAVGLDMPTTLAGHRGDRVQRAQDLSARAAAVVDKTRNLIILETEAAYLKWREASENARRLQGSGSKGAGVADDTAFRFTSGKASTEDVIRAYALQLEVLSGSYEARWLYAVALAGLERITAGGFVPPFRSPTTRRHP
jgi:outer membrane protein TolC